MESMSSSLCVVAGGSGCRDPDQANRAVPGDGPGTAAWAPAPLRAAQQRGEMCGCPPPGRQRVPGFCWARARDDLSGPRCRGLPWGSCRLSRPDAGSSSWEWGGSEGTVMEELTGPGHHLGQPGSGPFSLLFLSTYCVLLPRSGHGNEQWPQHSGDCGAGHSIISSCLEIHEGGVANIIWNGGREGCTMECSRWDLEDK